MSSARAAIENALIRQLPDSQMLQEFPMNNLHSLATPAAFDVHAVRREFPMLGRTVHGKPLAYLDNGASAQRPRGVIAAVDDYERHHHANIHRGVHTLSQEATALYEGARERMVRFINARSRREIMFVRGTTEAINLVAQSYGRPLLKPGDEVLITHLEHHANIVPWQMLCEQTGAKLVVAPMDARGEVHAEAVEALMSAAHAPVRLRPRIQRPRHGPARAPADRRRQGARHHHAHRRRAGRAAHARSTCRSSAAISMPSPDTRCSDRRASACSTAARRCSSACRPGKAAAT